MVADAIRGQCRMSVPAGNRIMKKIIALLILAVAFMSDLSSAEKYELVLLNGRVIDPETKLNDIFNVGISGGRIKILTKRPISGTRAIDATGLVVAPGFIDGHCHSIEPLSLRLVVLDGVTTCMDLEAGASDIDLWYRSKSGVWPVNYGTTISQEFARVAVHDPEFELGLANDSNTLFTVRVGACEDGDCGWQTRVSDKAQIVEINKILDEGLRLGALGVGSLLAYARQGISSLEQYEAQKVAALYGRVTSVHSRFHGNLNPPSESAIGLDEVLTNAIALDAPLIYAHNNQHGWMEIEEKLTRLRRQGYNVWSEYYPYAAASTSVSATFLRPENITELGVDYHNMYDPITDRILGRTGYDELVTNFPDREIILFIPRNEGWVSEWVKSPGMTVGSDSMWNEGADWETPLFEFKGHPRTSGSHAKVLQVARENNVPLELSIAQLSYLSAKYLGDTGLADMRERGRIQEGMIADITIFDPQSVRAMSTFRAGEQGAPSNGIPFVIVYGQVVVDDGEFTKTWAGQPIRFPVEVNSRYAVTRALP